MTSQNHSTIQKSFNHSLCKMEFVTKKQVLLLFNPDFSENWIDLLAVASFSITTVGCIALARITDYLRGHMKIIIFILLAGAGVVYSILSLVCIGVRI